MTYAGKTISVLKALRIICLVALPLGACATGGEPVQKLAGAMEGPKDASAAAALVRLGKNALATGDYREAFVHYSRALQSQPKNPEALIGLGESYLAAGNFEKAAATFLKAENSTLSDLAYQGRGIALTRLGKNTEAHDLLLMAVTRNPELGRAWNALGCTFDRRRQWERANAAYAKASALRPNDPQVHNNRGVSLLMQKRFKDGLDAFEAALRAAPGLRKAEENRRLALAFLGRYLDATATVPPEGRPAVLNNVGFAAMQKGNFVLAERYLLEAMETSPSYYEKAAKNLEVLRYKRSLQQTRLRPL
jgi:Flp pilus assembly protein TadD